MHTGQLESFIQVAENLNFARAAEILNMTQSAVSRQIRALEEELGAKLLYRTTRTVALTSAGISFLSDAKSIMRKLKTAEKKIQSQINTNIQPLAIACTNDIHLNLISSILQSCREKIPRFQPVLQVVAHRSILNLFYQNMVDVLFGFKEDIRVKGDIIYKELIQTPLCCVLPCGHLYAMRWELEEQELYAQKIILCNAYGVPAEAVEIQNHIAQHLLPENVYTCENLQALLTLVKAGYGCSVLPAVTPYDPELSYVPIADRELLSYGFYYKRDDSNPLLKNFVSIAGGRTVDKNQVGEN